MEEKLAKHNYTGKFSTTIAETATEVSYKIYPTYEVNASFSIMGVEYTFNMPRWMKTKEGTKNPYSLFDRFAELAYARFGDLVPDNTFGKYENLAKKGEEKVLILNETQRLSLLKYAMRDVFVCAEQIISLHEHSYLNYALFHREMDDSTYEKYLHVVACHCLVHSNFLAPGVIFLPIDFAKSKRAFDRSIWEQVKNEDSKKED